MAPAVRTKICSSELSAAATSLVITASHSAPLSAAELLLAGHPDPTVLERLLRLLASRGIFSEHGGAGDSLPRRCALTAVGRTVVPGPSGASYVDCVLQHHQNELVAAWTRLHEAVLDPDCPEPFTRAHASVPAYGYYGRDRCTRPLQDSSMAPLMWPDLIAKCKEGGTDIIEKYVFWNGHEPEKGQYYFEGRFDLVKFAKLVAAECLFLFLCIGPYACAEWNFRI